MMDCVILAGGVPQTEDLLYEYTQGQPKALIELAGKPMVQWVLDALERAPSISRIIVVGLGPDSGLTAAKLAGFVPDQGSMLQNGIAGTRQVLALNPAAKQVLMCSSDIPLVKPAMIESFIRQCTDTTVDLYHSVVSREIMEKRFPESRRSYAKVIDGEFAAGDMHMIAPHIIDKHQDLWDALMGNRKNVIKQAMNLGPGFMVKYATGRMSFDIVQRMVLKKFGINARLIPVENPEIGMDADKEFQLEICRQELLKQGK